jgi:8-oxo-dGTP pyrophosphatase MutT (NUDIX family)
MQTPVIRPIALCLLSRGNQILVYEDQDKVKGDSFFRPLGGGIEFGETSTEAVKRELREELSQEVTNLTLLGTLEYFFTFNGKPGHEIVFIYDGRLVDEELYSREQLDGFEHGANLAFNAVWRSPAELRALGVRLVPEGLEPLLENRKDTTK